MAKRKRLIGRGGYCNIPIFHRTVIALKQNRPGFLFPTVKGSPGDPRDDLVVDDRFPVGYHSNPPPDQCDIVGLPFPCLFGDILIWSQESVYPTQVD